MLGDPHRYDPCNWGGEVSPDIHRWSPQVDWISLNGRIAVDRVLRMEKLAEEFTEVCRQLGRPALRLPRCNRRLHWHYSWYYDDATRDLIARYYAKDVEAFGYRFESKLGEAQQQRALASLFGHSARNWVFRTVRPRQGDNRTGPDAITARRPPRSGVFAGRSHRVTQRGAASPDILRGARERRSHGISGGQVGRRRNLKRPGPPTRPAGTATF